MKGCKPLFLCFLPMFFCPTFACEFKNTVGDTSLFIGITTKTEIIKKFGYSEEFSYSELGTKAMCYRTPFDEFIIFGFDINDHELRLTSIDLGVTPPTGHDDTFCKAILSVKPLNVNSINIGIKENGFRLKGGPLISKTIKIIESGKACSLTYERRYVGSTVVHVSYTLSTYD